MNQDRCGLSISRHDFEQLLEGNEREIDRGHRSLFLGAAASGGLGVSSLLAHVLAEGSLPLLLGIVLASVTLATGALAIFFHRRAGSGDSRESHRLLIEEVRQQLRLMHAITPLQVSPEDPRYWP